MTTINLVLTMSNTRLDYDPTVITLPNWYFLQNWR